jgi:hypothetical protein
MNKTRLAAGDELMLMNKTRLATIVGLSPHTFRRYRERGYWQKGIHFVKVNQDTVLYNKELVLDWLANRDNPAQHQRKIDQYLASLSNHEEATTPKSKARQRQGKRAE